LPNAEVYLKDVVDASLSESMSAGWSNTQRECLMTGH
jgi:hypothetical protein